MSQQIGLFKIQLEAEVKLRLNLEDKLKMSYKRNEELQDRLESAARGETYFRNMVEQYSQGVSRLVPILNRLQENPGVREDGFV
jgi:chromosome condensin MukBEF ATPase and DNA-binding subunit MukB